MEKGLRFYSLSHAYAYITANVTLIIYLWVWEDFAFSGFLFLLLLIVALFFLPNLSGVEFFSAIVKLRKKIRLGKFNLEEGSCWICGDDFCGKIMMLEELN